MARNFTHEALDETCDAGAFGGEDLQVIHGVQVTEESHAASPAMLPKPSEARVALQGGRPIGADAGGGVIGADARVPSGFVHSWP